MPFGIGVWELLIVLAVVALVFGPKRLPQLARSLGKGAREVRDAVDPFHEPVTDMKDALSLESGRDDTREPRRSAKRPRPASPPAPPAPPAAD